MPTLISLKIPEHISGWSIKTNYNGTFSVFLVRKFDILDNFGRVLGPGISALAEASSLELALDLALEKIERLMKEKLEYQNNHPPIAPREYPAASTAEVEDLLSILGI